MKWPTILPTNFIDGVRYIDRTVRLLGIQLETVKSFAINVTRLDILQRVKNAVLFKLFKNVK